MTSRLIVTVTPNPSVDRTVLVDSVTRGTVNRAQSVRVDACLEERFEARLDDRAAADVDGGDFFGIDVDADDIMPIAGKVRRGNASDVAKAEYGNSHTVAVLSRDSGLGIRDWIVPGSMV
jgi:hypothetical protein